MIGHPPRRGHPALFLRRRRTYTAAPTTPSPFGRRDRTERGNHWAPSWRPGANPGTCPVARIGRASPSAHPVGRQPTRGPVPARIRTPVCRGPPGRAGRARCCGCHRCPARIRPARGSPLPPSRPALEPRARAGRPSASPTGRRACHTPHGRAVPASPSAAAPPASPPRVAAAAVGRPIVDSRTCRAGGPPRTRARPARRPLAPGGAPPDAQLVRCASCGS